MGYYFELTQEEEAELQYQEHLKLLYEEMYLLQKDKQRLLGISGELSDADNKARTPF